MKRNRIIISLLLVPAVVLMFQGCKKTMVPYLTHYAFTIPALVAPANNSFVNPTNTIDLSWSSVNESGDPQNWDVYFGNTEDPPLIKTGYTSETVSVDITPGVKYYWKVVGFDVNGMPTSGAIWSFEVINPLAELSVKMQWTTDIAQKIGINIDPAAAVDMRLKILKSDKSVLTIENTNGFESYSFPDDLPDGTYYVATDIASTANAGDFNAPIDISVSLFFNQRGILTQSISLPSVMTNIYVCPVYTVIFATVTKTGNSYTVLQDLMYPSSPLTSNWVGTDGDYPSLVETFLGCFLMQRGLVFDWMSDFWGETIIDGGMSSLEVDTLAGTVTIPDQYYCTTTYNGAVQPTYNINGTGTYTKVNGYPVLTINYDLVQEGFDIGQYLFDNGYMSKPYFTAHITTNPNGFPAGKSSVPMHRVLTNKPRF